jgi:hypothetical protein
MPLKKYIQAAGERKRYTINYSEWLDTGEYINTVVFTVLGTATSPALVVDDVMVLPTPTGAQYYVSGGVDNIQYSVLVTATTATGQIKEDVLLFTIREPA